MDIKDIISSGLLELYVLGMASEQETAEVTALAKQYPEVAAEIASIEAGLQTYAMLYSVEPTEKIKENIFSKINRTAQTNISNTTMETGKLVQLRSFWKYAAAASIILLIGSAIFNVVYYNKYHDANKNYETAQNNLVALEQSNDAMKKDLLVVQSKYSEPYSLNGLPAAPDAKAKIFWMKNTTHEVYIDASNLPDPPAGKQYQFWGIVDGKPVDGGMIVTTKKGETYRIQKMKNFGKADAFAVTLEPEGGMPQPTGQMYVMGKM